MILESTHDLIFCIRSRVSEKKLPPPGRPMPPSSLHLLLTSSTPHPSPLLTILRVKVESLDFFPANVKVVWFENFLPVEVDGCGSVVGDCQRSRLAFPFPGGKVESRLVSGLSTLRTVVSWQRRNCEEFFFKRSTGAMEYNNRCLTSLLNIYCDIVRITDPILVPTIT